MPGHRGICRTCCRTWVSFFMQRFQANKCYFSIYILEKLLWQPLVPDESEGRVREGEAMKVAQVKDGAALLQTGSSESGPDLDSSLGGVCTGVGEQLDVKDEGEIFDLGGWMDKEYGRQSRFQRKMVD